MRHMHKTMETTHRFMPILRFIFKIIRMMEGMPIIGVLLVERLVVADKLEIEDLLDLHIEVVTVNNQVTDVMVVRLVVALAVEVKMVHAEVLNNVVVDVVQFAVMDADVDAVEFEVALVVEDAVEVMMVDAVELNNVVDVVEAL